MTTTGSFELLVENYQTLVFNTAVRLLGNFAEAQDIAQEVFLRAYRRYPQVRDCPRIGGWLRTVTRNLCLNYLNRYRGRWRFFSEMKEPDEEEDFLATVAAPNNGVLDAVAADQNRLCQAALEELPPAQKIPLVLFHFEDLDYQEIAARLGWSLSKVKNNIFRGRRTLRRKLALER